jgi:transcriptional regulator with XRE-family HTH domain
MVDLMRRNKKVVNGQKAKNGFASRKNLAINMQLARTVLGWSQDQLGENCGLKRTYIGAIERQEINPGVDNLDRIGVGLGVPSYILIREPETAQPLIYRSLRTR